MMRGRMAQAPISQPPRPTRLNRKATFAAGVPIRMSDAMARIAPAPAQTPSIAATIGCGQPRIALTRSPVIRVKSSEADMAFAVSGQMLVHVAARAEIAAGPRDDHRFHLPGI